MVNKGGQGHRRLCVQCGHMGWKFQKLKLKHKLRNNAEGRFCSGHTSK